MQALQRRTAGVQLHPTSPAVRDAWATTRYASSTGWRPRASRGGRCCRSGRRTELGSPYKSRSAFAGVARAARRARCAGERRRDRRVPRARGVLDRRLGARRRRPAGGRRPGPLRPRVERAARLRRRARRRGSSATCRSTSRRAAPTTAPIPSCSAPARCRARRPTPSPTRASSGATRCTTGRRCSAAATAGGSSGCGAPSTWSTSRGSTTSAASSPTGRCPRARPTRAAGAGGAGPGRAVFDAAAARARRAAGHRRGPRRHHRAGRPAAPRARLPGHGRHAVRLRPDDPHGPHRLENHEEPTGRLHRHARPRHAARLVGDAGRRRRARPPRRRSPAARDGRGRAVVVADPADVLARRRGWRWCRRRTSSGSAARRG